nr:zinc finger, CCHC-type [Tanacetum cinerariifolium]
MGERGIECIFVGYVEHSKAFRFYVIDLNDSVSINTIIKLRDAIFDENRFSSVPRPSLMILNGTKDIGGSVVPEEDVAFWKEAINDEMDSIMGNNTWVLADLPPGCKPLGCKWIFTRKLKMYVKTAFLNGDLDEEVLKKFNYFDCTPKSTPMDTSEKLMPNNGQAASQLEYSRMIGCLMYAMTCTRPDITFVVGKLSRLTYTGYLSVGRLLMQAGSATPKTIHLQVAGYLLGGGAIFWASKKQTCITGSTIESEFVALAAAGKKAEWLKNLLLEILLWSKPITSISIRCDSAATLAKTYSQMYNGKSRHLIVRHSMICELITNKVISIEFVRSQQNLADHLTKGLARDLVINSAEGMRLKSN